MSQSLFENFCLKNFNLVMMIVFWINRVARPQAQLLFLRYFVILVLVLIVSFSFYAYFVKLC